MYRFPLRLFAKVLGGIRGKIQNQKVAVLGAIALWWSINLRHEAAKIFRKGTIFWAKATQKLRAQSRYGQWRI